jgi:hypothetical protein
MGARNVAMSAVSVIGSRESGKETVSPQPKLLDRLREALRSRQYSSRTENIYCYWVKHSFATHLLKDAYDIRTGKCNPTSYADQSKYCSVKEDIIKTVLCVLLFGIVLVGCAGGPPPMAPHEKATVEQRQPEVIFPGIKPVFRAFNLQVIETYCQQRYIQKLGTDRVRLFIQPMGVVAEAVEIDLMNRQLTVYPGTHTNCK